MNDAWMASLDVTNKLIRNDLWYISTNMVILCEQCYHLVDEEKAAFLGLMTLHLSPKGSASVETNWFFLILHASTHCPQVLFPPRGITFRYFGIRSTNYRTSNWEKVFEFKSPRYDELKSNKIIWGLHNSIIWRQSLHIF